MVYSFKAAGAGNKKAPAFRRGFGSSDLSLLQARARTKAPLGFVSFVVRLSMVIMTDRTLLGPHRVVNGSIAAK
ncbi:MAG: hypothetical protein KGJ78_13395, partial [Alphaproteobacteria bacterium]|nr:hypothetical protein [Alphaproteobacteria bacterium]